LLYPLSQRDIHAAQQRIASDEKRKIVETPCGPIEYAVEGPEDGPPLLVVHGGFDQGLLIGKPLVERGFRVIAPSRFGFLSTPLPPNNNNPVSLSSQADAHACLLDALKIHQVAGVVGVSTGAASLLKFVQRYSNCSKALVIWSPSIHISVPDTNQTYFKMHPFAIPMVLLSVS
jgi:pimeloyl-ACP methyl ester carboxylesterase